MCRHEICRMFIQPVGGEGFFFSSIDASGNSGGLLSSYTHSLGPFYCFSYEFGILIKGFSFSLVMKLSLVNCYGSYENIINFWSYLLECDFTNKDNFIVVGYLNLSLS